MKKILVVLILINNILIYAEKPGYYSMVCTTANTNDNYDVYVNGWKNVGYGSKAISDYVKQGQNEFKIIARDSGISNISIRIIDYRNPKSTKVMAEWNIDCRVVTNHTKTLNLEMYGFTHAWEDADDLTTLTLADKTEISNIISNRMYFHEFEDNITFGNYHSNAYSNKVTHIMKKFNKSFDKTFEMIASIQKKVYWGSGRKSFQKYDVDYIFEISPFNSKVLYVDFKKNGKGHPLWKIESTYTDDTFNYDLPLGGGTFFKKNGKWWVY